MATYNYYNQKDPLNLNPVASYLRSNSVNIQTDKDNNRYRNDPTYRFKYDTNPAFREAELNRVKQEEEDKRKKQRELEAKKQSNLSKVQQEKFIQGLSSPEYKGLNPQQRWNQAGIDAIYARDDKNKELFPTQASLHTARSIYAQNESERQFQPQYNDINNLTKFTLDWTEENLNPFIKETKEYAIKKGYTIKENVDEEWDNMSLYNKALSTLNALGHKYLKGQTLEYFNSLDSEDKYNFLCTITSSDPRYKTLASKLKEETKEKGNKVSESLSDVGLGKAWRDNTDYLTNRFMHLLAGGNGWNLWGAAGDLGAGILAGVGHLGNMIGSLGDTAASAVYYYGHGGSGKEDIDDKIRAASDAYITKYSKKDYDSFMVNATKEQKKEKVDLMKALSRDKENGSNYFKLHEGDSYTKNVTDDELIKEYFKYKTREDLFGKYNAIKGMQNYWQDVVAGNQDWIDCTVATGAQFVDTFAADLASFAAVVANPIFMPIDTHGSYDPNDWTVNGEGYSDALIKRNGLLKWASGLQETGCWSLADQEKYKELNLSKDQLYRTVAQENQFMSANDIGDIIGQYGFTAATACISLGGSAVLRQMAKKVAQNYMRSTTKLLTKEAKQILKDAYRQESIQTGLTEVKNIASNLGSNTLYRGNLIVSSMVGTAEGALEARQTYETFMKDNEQRINSLYKERFEKASMMTRDELRSYMIAQGYESSLVRNAGDTTGYSAEFTEQQYEQARQEILSQLENSRQQDLARMEDDALDAAYVNFLSNSAINGMLNVFGKELTLSKDAQSSIRHLRGKNKMTDLVSIEQENGKWVARVNKAIQNNKNNSWWDSTKQSLKDRKEAKAKIKEAEKKLKNASKEETNKLNVAKYKAEQELKHANKAIKEAITESTVGKMIKNAGSEAKEEFSQTVSDAVSRAAFENDLNQYLSTIYDKDARDQFMTDWTGVVTAGLNEFTSNALNVESVKAGLIGFLSTMVGGASPAAFIQRMQKPGQEQKEAKGFWNNVKSYSKWAGSTLAGLYDGAIRQAIESNREDYAYAQRLQESTERWLQNDKNQELITHMGGAIGFFNLMQDSFLAGDEFTAKNHHLGMAVENNLMLEALKDTEMYAQYQKALQERAQLSSLVEDEETSQMYFDVNGNLNTQNLIDSADPNLDSEEDIARREIAKNLSSLITQFRNANSQNFNSNMTDLEVIQRIAKNAQEMMTLNNRISQASKRLDKIFAGQDLDPLVKSSYIYAMIAQEDSRERAKSLTKTLQDATNSNNEIFNEEDKKVLTEQPEQHLNQVGINLAIEYGGIDAALQEYNKLRSESNKLETEKTSAKTRAERKQAKERQKEVDKEIILLGFKLKQAGIITEQTNESTTENTEAPAILQNAGETITLSDSNPIQNQQPLISVKDLIDMSPEQRYDIFNNISSYSEEQQKVINQFLELTRKGLSESRQDPALTIEDVLKDYKDQYKLIHKSKTYDALLNQYINNPEFLNKRAAELQYENRVRTLKYLYRNDLELKEGETVLDMRDRVKAKIEDLREQEKYQDAEILQKLLSEHKEVKKAQEAYNSIAQMSLILGTLNPEQANSIDFTKVIAELQTLVAASDKTLDEIKQMFDNNDIEGITKLLKAQFNNGDYFLNKFYKDMELSTLDSVEDIDLSDRIQSIKNYLDSYYKIKASMESEGKPHQVQGPAQPTSSQDPASKHQSSTKTASTPNTGKAEPNTLKILSPGELPNNTPETAKLYDFINDKKYGVSAAVQSLNNANGGVKVQFMVTNEFGSPQIFAVVETDSSREGTFKINNKHYQIIGAIDSSQSPQLSVNAANTYATLTDTNKHSLLQGSTEALHSSFSLIKSPTSIGETNQNNSKPIKDLLQGSTSDRTKARILDWIQKVLNGAKRINSQQLTTDQEEKLLQERKPYLQDHNGYPFAINPEINSFAEIKLNDGRTVEEVLLSNATAQEKINALIKGNPAFARYFQSWKEISTAAVNGATKNSKNHYLYLLGNFFYLGYLVDKPDLGTRQIRVTLNEHQEDLDGERVPTLDIYSGISKDSPLSIAIPLSSDSEAVREEKALQALIDIYTENIDTENGKILYALPQINWNLILGNSKFKSEIELPILQGWIEAGILVGYIPSAVSRQMEIRNPYAGAASSNRPTGGSNVGSPNMDPGNAGYIPGGNKNLQTGQVEGNPESVEQKIEKQLSEAAKRAKNIVDRIIQRSKNIKFNKESHTYTNSETNQTSTLSATQGEEAFIGGKATGWKGTNEEKTISTAFGNTMDNLYRATLDFLSAQEVIPDVDTLYKQVLLDPAFKGKKEIPNHSAYYIKQILREAINFKQLCDLRGWHIVSKDLKIFGHLPVMENGIQVGLAPTAGALDILVYDNEGIFHIIDIKTKNIDENIESKFKDSASNWQTQVSTYQSILQQMFPEMIFGQNYILPIGVYYNFQFGSGVIVEDDDMTVQNQMATGAPKMLPTIRGIKTENAVLDDYLYEIDTLPFNGYDFNKLTEEQKQGIIPTVTINQGNPLASPGDPIDPPSSTGGPSLGGTSASAYRDDMGLDDLLGNDSRRTQRQARFTDFVNTHIANMVKPKLNIISKTVVKLKELFTNTGYVDRLITQDLASTFFDGDIEKFQRVCGKDVSLASLPAIIASIRDYYNAYSSNRQWYIKNITNRHEAAKLVYQLINKEITINELEQALEKMEVSAQNIPELIEYLTAENPEEVGKTLLSKLEKSKLHTAEEQQKRLKEFTDFMDSIDAKLDFINSNRAIDMLTTRISSIRESILSHNVEEMSYEKNDSLEDLFAGKQGNYGAQKLLRGIATGSKNKHFRKLAARLLNEVKQKNIFINVTLDDGSITDIEGESKGINITIHKASLSSQDRLERVILHEMLHSIVKASPEIKEMLQEYLDTTINQLVKTTDMTRTEIIQQHYGLSSVDEFISEYFTNLAFQESLKGISDTTENFNSIYDRISHSIKSFFTNEKSIYDEITPIMESLIGVHNTESTKKSIQREQTSFIKKDFNKLEEFQQQIITKKGFTAKQFNELPSILQELLTKCCL